MAVYKIFPEKDTTVYTEQVLGNSGFDEMLEVGGYPIIEIAQAQRFLIQFPSNQVNSIINKKINGAPYSASLNIKLAEAYEAPVSFSIEAYPVYEYWDGGAGKFQDVPYDSSGASWRYPKGTQLQSWILPFNTVVMPTGVTGSYSSQYPGGGNWYHQINGNNVKGVQYFDTNTNLDLNIDITPAVGYQNQGTINNNGFVVKLQDEFEFYQSASIKIKYYSVNTNTIYPPSLDLKWDDSSYLTGSLSVLNNSECVVELTNNKGEYVDEGKQRFRLLARPKNPVRTFTTGSIYKTNYALPSGSYWGLKDEFTEEMVIPFDDFATKISCDSVGSYFDIYMDGLQPERYYRVLVKSDIDGTTTVLDNKNIFKVVRNG